MSLYIGESNIDLFNTIFITNFLFRNEIIQYHEHDDEDYFDGFGGGGEFGGGGCDGDWI